MSDKNPSYFQFPLCALAFGKDPQERLEHIVSFSLIDYGYKKLITMSDEEREKVCRRIDTTRPVQNRTKGRKLLEYCGLFGAESLNETMPDPEGAIARYGALGRFVDLFSDRFGNLPLVRIRTDIFQDAYKGKISYRQFAILAGIFSSIGSQLGAVRITRDTIAIRSLGYHKRSMAEEHMRERADGAGCFTTSQIRTTVDKLHELKFFARCHLGNKTRHTYFSHRLDEDELRDAVKKRKLYRLEFKAEQARKNAEAAEEVRACKEAIEKARPSKTPGPSPSLPQASPSTSEEMAIMPPPPMGSRLSDRVAKATQAELESRPAEKSADGRAVPALDEEMEPPGVDTVRDHFESLWVGYGRHAEAYMQSRDWQKERKRKEPWRASSGRWVFEFARRERARAVVT